MSLSLSDIAKIAERLPNPVGHKYTLNFAVMESTILNEFYLDALFGKEKFIVKITSIHNTKSATESGYNTITSYDKYDVYKKF